MAFERGTEIDYENHSPQSYSGLYLAVSFCICFIKGPTGSTQCTQVIQLSIKSPQLILEHCIRDYMRESFYFRG